MILINISNKKIIGKKDIYIVFAIFLMGIIAVAAAFILKKTNMGKTAVISVNTQVIEKIDLETHENNRFTIENIEDVVFEVNNGKIRIIESDCPDKICIKTGYISSTGEKIVCLPKKLIVEIED